MQYLAFRNLVGVSHSEAEVKAMAEEEMMDDGPDQDGNMFTRPGKLSDYFPRSKLFSISAFRSFYDLKTT